MPKYNFKLGPELAWAVAVTVIGVVATAIATQGSSAPANWGVWMTGLAAGVARALLGLLLAGFGPGEVEKS